jgi:hypothetical protein
LKKLVVPEEILQEIGLVNKKEVKNPTSEAKKSQKEASNKKDRTIKVDNHEKAVSDFVPLKSYR